MRRNLTILVALLALLLLASAAMAQDKPTAEKGITPVLSELDALKIELIISNLDGTQAKITALQKDLELQRIQANAFTKALEKEGFSLIRGNDGKWVYEPKPDPKQK